MRLSVDENDPGYSPRVFEATVKLDGVELRNCITADEEAGYCLVYALDDERRPIVVGDHLIRKTVHGRVEIVFP
jgi:hypothetical protein